MFPIFMDNNVLTISLIGVSTALLAFYLLRRNQTKYPPGPYTLPLLGNLHQLIWSGTIIKFCEDNRNRFGKAFTFEFGGNKRVVISGYEAIYELLIKNADYTSNRSTSSTSRLARDLLQKTPGLLWAPFPHWKTLRSFALVSLREDGMGKAAFEPQILDEIDQYIHRFIEPHFGQPINMYHSLPQATSNIISQLLYAKRFEYDDEKFNKLIAALNEMVSLSMKIAMFNNVPFRSLLLRSTLQRLKYVREQLLGGMKAHVDGHKQTLDRDHPRDLIDRLLLSEGTEECFSDDNALILSIHLYGAGAETTSTALRWVLLLVCLHPNIKEKVLSEIDEQIGQDRTVAYKDHLNMPYTDAVLLETFRYANIVPSNLPHTLEKEMVIDGKVIPAGADLLLNMASVLHDEAVFEEPKKFKPERYLSGDIVLKKQRTIPFSIGRRACLGESLAKVEFFLFFVTFLQRYDVSLPKGASAKIETVTSVINAPKPYNIIFTKR